MNARKMCLFMMFVLGLFLLTACATPTPEIKSPPPTLISPTPVSTTAPKVLRILNGWYPDVLDPQKTGSITEIAVLKLCYEGLTTIDSQGMIQPGAADKWTVSQEGTVMTFHIREGLKRADGTPMNASDFEYALKREVDPRVIGKQYADIVHDVKGADELIALEGKKIAEADLAKLFANYGVQADNAKRELTVAFKYPVGYWNYIAYIWITYPVDRASVETGPDWYLKPANHKCNGPFQISLLDEGKRIVLEANPHYWRGKPKLDRIDMVYVADQYQGYVAYTKNEFEIVAVNSVDLAQVVKDTSLQGEFLRYPSASVWLFMFNLACKPFNDKQVRIAFSQAFDREVWARDVLRGIAKPYTRLIPPGVLGAQPDKPGVPASDPQAAIETLLRAGYGKPDGKTIDCDKLGEIKFAYGASSLNQLRFQFIAGNLTSVFNCPVTLDPLDATTLARLIRDPNTLPQIVRTGWIQDYPHPQNWLSVPWRCSSGIFSKRYGYCNAELDELLLQADRTLDLNAALGLYQQAEDMLLSDVPGVPTNYNELLYLLKPYVIGPQKYISSADADWPGEWGPIWAYDIDLSQVPASYPKK